MLESLITSKPRIHLAKFFINTSNIGYLHGFTEVMNESAKAILKEFNILCEVGYLKKGEIPNRILCKTKNPLLASLPKKNFSTFLTRYHSDDAFGTHGIIEKIVVIGDYSNVNDGGTIELFDVGEAG